MHSLLASIVLCAAAQTAAAQSFAPEVAATKGGELIAAGTRDGPAIHKLPANVGHGQRPATDQEHSGRGGASMVWAAVAMMSAIALRRAGTPFQ